MQSSCTHASCNMQCLRRLVKALDNTKACMHESVRRGTCAPAVLASEPSARSQSCTGTPAEGSWATDSHFSAAVEWAATASATPDRNACNNFHCHGPHASKPLTIGFACIPGQSRVPHQFAKAECLNMGLISRGHTLRSLAAAARSHARRSFSRCFVIATSSCMQSSSCHTSHGLACHFCHFFSPVGSDALESTFNPRPCCKL